MIDTFGLFSITKNCESFTWEIRAERLRRFVLIKGLALSKLIAPIIHDSHYVEAQGS